MNKAEVLRKAEAGEGLTVAEIKAYQKAVSPKEHKYGKYGSLALIYLEEHNPAKLWALAGDLPEYLHGIDKAAGRLYDVTYKKLSENPDYKKTGDFMKDLQIETEKKRLIEEEILSELVYAD